MSFACIGDIHLGWLSVYHQEQGDKLQLSNLKSVFAAIKQSGQREVVLLGDIFHTPYPDRNLELAFARLLIQCGLRITIIMGNHDFANVDEHSLRTAKWLQDMELINVDIVTKPKLKRLGGIDVWLCPHPYKIKAPSKVAYCIGHFAWSGATYDNGRECVGEENPKGEWVLGDFHRFQTGRGYTYAGSISQVGWDETLPKGYLVVEFDDVRFVQHTPTYTLSRATIKTAQDLAELEPSVFYSIVCKNVGLLPDGWKTKYPNILRSQTKAVKAEEALTTQPLDINPVKKVEDWIAARTTKKPKLGKRATSLARQIILVNP